MNSRTRAGCQLEEVFVFGDQHHAVLLCVAPNRTIGALIESNVQDVNAVRTSLREKSRQGSGQLIIDEEFHEACKIGWSAWWAAYSIAAKMSSLSRKG